MRLTKEERAKNREAFRKMNLSGKLEYIFAYYKFPLVLALIAAVAVGSVLYYSLTRKEPLLYVACANVSAAEDLESAYFDGFLDAAGVSSARYEVRVYRNLYLSKDATVQNHEYAYASQLKVMAAMANGELDVLLMNREAYDIMSNGGYLMPLADVLGGNLLGRVSDHLASNTVILKDNSIEHNLDESIPYQAETEESVNAILISDFPLFSSAEFTGDVYLGIVGNSVRLDAVLQYIDYLTSAAPSGAE